MLGFRSGPFMVLNLQLGKGILYRVSNLEMPGRQGLCHCSLVRGSPPRETHVSPSLSAGLRGSGSAEERVNFCSCLQSRAIAGSPWQQELPSSACADFSGYLSGWAPSLSHPLWLALLGSLGQSRCPSILQDLPVSVKAGAASDTDPSRKAYPK